MKRSEMLNKIATIVHGTRRATEAYTSNEIAEMILSDIEDAGMEPPKYQYWNSSNPKDVNERGIPKNLSFSRYNGDEINEWEPEDNPSDEGRT